MDESKNSVAVLLTKKAVIVCETSTVFSYFSDEGVGLLVAVMEMHFNVANPESHHFRDTLDEVTLVLFLWIEKTVLGDLICSVSGSVCGNLWPRIAPTCYAAERDVNGSAAAQWFVVIHDANPRTPHFLMLRGTPDPILQVRNQPGLRV